MLPPEPEICLVSGVEDHAPPTADTRQLLVALMAPAAEPLYGAGGEAVGGARQRRRAEGQVVEAGAGPAPLLGNIKLTKRQRERALVGPVGGFVKIVQDSRVSSDAQTLECGEVLAANSQG
ncbi:hypothetical protein HIM_02430 [Hirsutella minnesotensis 3608]|nr:hypothetical protein HIM_02430 [Hirsutella minnesotensis 3608]